MNISKEQLKRSGKKAAAATAGVLAAAALALGSLADTPQELFSGTQQAVIAKADVADAAEPEKKPTLRDRLRRFFLGQPSVVRGIVLLPLWAVGKGLLALLSGLFTALQPALQAVLGVFLNAALLFGLSALVFKLLFPDKHLKDVFTKRNIVWLVSGAVLLAAADAILRVFWEEYRPVSIAIKLAAGLLVLALLCWRVFGKRTAKKAIQPA